MNRLSRFVETLGRAPVIPLAGLPGVSLTEKSVKANLTRSDNQVETLRALYEEIRADAVFVMMDLTVEAEFLGCGLKFPENDTPSVQEHVLDGKEDPEKIFEGKRIGGRMPLFAEVVKGLKRLVDVPVCAYAIGPFTLAGELMEPADVFRATKKNPDYLHRVLSKAAELIKHYTNYLDEAGADLICITEMSGVMLSPRTFEEFSGQYCSRIFASDLSAMTALHICGNTTQHISKMEAIGAEGLSLDADVNLPEIYDRLRGDTVLIGNLDPVGVLAQKSPDFVRAKSKELLKSMEGKNNFILSSGCDIPQITPLENIKAMISARDY